MYVVGVPAAAVLLSSVPFLLLRVVALVPCRPWRNATTISDVNLGSSPYVSLPRPHRGSLVWKPSRTRYQPSSRQHEGTQNHARRSGWLNHVQVHVHGSRNIPPTHRKMLMFGAQQSKNAGASPAAPPALLMPRDSSLMASPMACKSWVSYVAASPMGWGNTVAPISGTLCGVLLDLTTVPCRHSFPQEYLSTFN